MEEYLKSKGRKLSSKVNSSLLVNYRPELDTTAKLELSELAHYQFLISILRQIVELGKIDIYLETFMIILHIALPREEHLEIVYRIFTYLKKYYNTKMVFDPSDLEVEIKEF